MQYDSIKDSFPEHLITVLLTRTEVLIENDFVISLDIFLHLCLDVINSKTPQLTLPISNQS